MNSLNSTYDQLTVLGFPCNQHGHQTQEKDFEILDVLKHVRPGGGYEPNFEMFSIRSQAVHELPIPWDQVVGATAYGVCYTATVLALAMWVFERRDLK